MQLKVCKPDPMKPTQNVHPTESFRLSCPSDAPSPNATGQIFVKLDGIHGTSVLDARAKKLDVGNGYCAWILGYFGETTPPCDNTSNVLGNTAHFLNDTSKGQQIFEGALSNDVVRVDQISGKAVEIRDIFGVTHLRGVIP